MNDPHYYLTYVTHILCQWNATTGSSNVCPVASASTAAVAAMGMVTAEMPRMRMAALDQRLRPAREMMLTSWGLRRPSPHRTRVRDQVTSTRTYLCSRIGSIVRAHAHMCREGDMVDVFLLFLPLFLSSSCSSMFHASC